MRRSGQGLVQGIAFVAGLAVCGAGAPAVPPPAVPERSEVRFTIGEAALLDWLRAATPYAVAVGQKPLALDLVLSDPANLTLKDGKATLTIRVRGRALAMDQVVSPVVTVAYDQKLDKYFAVVSSLPLAIQGLGTIDLKDYIPRFEFPALFENLWRFADRPVGMNLGIRRIAIIDHAIEVGANVTFGPVAPTAARAAR
jgi:hypothetical protein